MFRQAAAFGAAEVQAERPWLKRPVIRNQLVPTHWPAIPVHNNMKVYRQLLQCLLSIGIGFVSA